MINIHQIDFSYKKRKVLQNLSIHLTHGQVCGLLGKNGTGKSTLMHIMCGLLHPQKGSVEVLGFDAKKRTADFLQQIFIVPEEFHLPNVPIKEFVQTTAPFYPSFDHNIFTQYLELFAVPVESTLQEMSYGQKKKVLISFALATHAQLVLFDEPTNGLDIMSKSQFKKIIASITDEERIIIISTHQVKDLENLIDRLIVIDEGDICFNETLEKIQQRITFKLSFDTNETARALYAEESISGNAIVLENKHNEESKIDLELLYKTIILNPAEIKRIFTTTKH